MNEKTISAIVDSVCLAKNYSPPNAAEKINETAQFVCLQISHMPMLLKLGVHVICYIFNGLSFARYGRFFYRLSPKIQYQYLQQWRYSRFDFQRQFYKFIDSLATLNYYSPCLPSLKNLK